MQTPSTQEVPDSIAEKIKTADAVLLANHGALTVGKDVYDAYYKMETLEHFAGITMYARLLGGEVGLEPEQVSELIKIRSEKFGKSDISDMGAGFCGERAVNEAKEENEMEALIEKIVREKLEQIR